MPAPKDRLEPLVAAFADDIVEMSDDEVLVEFSADIADAKAIAEMMSALTRARKHKTLLRRSGLTARRAESRHVLTHGGLRPRTSKSDGTMRATFSEEKKDVTSDVVPSIRHKPDDGSDT